MRRLVIASLLAVAATTAGVGLRLASADAPPAWKNLKVLPKTISKSELKAVMKARSFGSDTTVNHGIHAARERSAASRRLVTCADRRVRAHVSAGAGCRRSVTRAARPTCGRPQRHRQHA